MQIQISWLLQKPTDLDLHCLQRQYISGFSRTRVKGNGYALREVTLSIPFCLASEKGSTLKGKNLQDVQERKQEVTKFVSLVKYGGKFTLCIQHP